MADFFKPLQEANRNLQFGKAVVERRAEMEAQCECLAAWIEGRECVCDSTVQVPLSTTDLKKAHQIVGQIEDCDRRLKFISAMQSETATCHVEPSGNAHLDDDYGNITFVNNRGHGVYHPFVSLPKSVLVAALNEERIKLMIELGGTGIVSVSRDNIRVIPK